MSEDEFSGEKSVVSEEPPAADGNSRPVVFFRSLAAICLIYATSGIILIPFGMLRFHQGAIPGDLRISLWDGPARSTSLQALWLLFASIIGAGLSLTLFVAALGGVRMRLWSLPLLRLWAASSVVVGAGGAVLWFAWLLPPWRDQLAEVRGVIDSLTSLGAWMLGSFLAVAMLVVTSHPIVRQVFGRSAPAAPPT